MTEPRKEHRSLTFALSKQTSQEWSVQLELLQESAEVITVQQDVQQGKLFEVTMFYDSNLLFEEGNKCFEFVKKFGFVHEHQFALQDDWNEGVTYQKHCHVAMKDGIPVKGNAKGETQTMNAPFGKKADFDFEVSLVEETITNNSNIWNLWIGNGNSGMDAVSQANGTDETQLNKGHRKQQKKRIWNIETTWSLIQEIEEGTQLKENGIQNDIIWLHHLRDRSSVTRTPITVL